MRAHCTYHVNLHVEVSLLELAILLRRATLTWRVGGACPVHHQIPQVRWSCVPGAVAVRLFGMFFVVFRRLLLFWCNWCVLECAPVRSGAGDRDLVTSERAKLKAHLRL
jgi:hypothetical protein